MLFDRILIDPGTDERDAALMDAVASANGNFSDKRIAWPPDDRGAFLEKLASEPEGMTGWNGGTKRHQWGGRSQVIAVWWSDRLGRKHLRVLGGNGPALCKSILFRTPGRRNPLSTLEQVYPLQTARLTRNGQTQLLALCDCGEIDTPEALGWTGERCGPCHDRLAEGTRLAPLSFALGAPASAVAGLAFSPDGRTLAIGSPQVNVALRDLSNGAVRELGLRSQTRDCVRWASGDRLVMLGNNDVGVWHRLNQEIERWPWPDLDTSDAEATLSGDGNTIAVASVEPGKVDIRSAIDGTIRRVIEIVPPEKVSPISTFSALALNHDGSTLAAATFSHQLEVRDATTGERLCAIVDDFIPSHLAWSKGEKLLVGVSNLELGQVRVWSVPSGERAIARVVPSDGLDYATFSPSGEEILLGGTEGNLIVLSADGNAESSLQWRNAMFLTGAWSADGQWFALGDNDGANVRLWSWPALQRWLGSGA